MCCSLPYRSQMLKRSVSNMRPPGELIIQPVWGRNDSSDGLNAAGKASVWRLCRHTAHARTQNIPKSNTTDSPCVRALRPSLLVSFGATDTFASGSEQHIPLFHRKKPSIRTQ